MALSAKYFLVSHFVRHFRLSHLRHSFNPVHFLTKQSKNVLPLHRCYVTVHNTSLCCVPCRKDTIPLTRIVRNFMTKPFSLQKSQNGDSNEKITITFITKDKKRIRVTAEVGEDILSVAHNNNIDMEGACGGSCACTTCHVYVQDEYFDKMEPIRNEEDDLLDKAPFLKPNSRLGCQVVLTKELDGMELTLPPATANFYVDGHVPPPH